MVILNVAAIFWLKGTFVALLTGSVKIIVGEVTTAMAPVVKLQTKLLDKGVPARFLAADVIVTVYGVFGARLLAGVKIAVVPE
jgi:hypothetical protein